jgi:hypothetical protein
MSTYLNTATYWDTFQEYDFRQWKNIISAQLLAAGFVKTADTGQIATNLQTPLGYVLYNGTALTLTGWQNAFDQSTGTTWSTGVAPTGGVLPNTIYLVWDAGSLATPTAATYKVYMQGANGDPAGWTLQGSTDNVSWTTLDTQTGISVTAGYQTYTIASPGAYRWYRLAVTNVRGTTTAMLFTDWQLMTSVPANIISFTPAFTSATTSTAIGYEIWRFADTLQSTVPCFFKIEYGVGGTNGMAGVWLTFGSASDGSGNILGLGITARTVLPTVSAPVAPNTFLPNNKIVGSYATNGSRIVLALGTNNPNANVLVIERLKTNAGADASTGVTFLVVSASMVMTSTVMPASGPVPVPETTAIVLAPTQSTGVTGTVTALYEVVAFMGPRQPMMLGCLAYFFANLTQDTPITVPVYGSNHTYYPVGNNLTGTARGAGSMSMAILYE